MSIAEHDIDGQFLVLRGLIREANKGSLDDGETEVLIDAGLAIVKSIVVDINRIANALEGLLITEQSRLQRDLS